MSTDIPALEAFGEDQQYDITADVVDQARELFVYVYTKNADDFKESCLGRLRAYKFLNNKSTLLSCFHPLRMHSFITSSMLHWQLQLTRVRTSTNHRSRHMKSMDGL
jgi:hypothetical protein